MELPQLLLADDYIDSRTFVVRLIPVGLVEILDLDAEVDGQHWHDGDSIYLPLLGEFGPLDIEKVIHFHRSQLIASAMHDETLMPLAEISEELALVHDNLRQAIHRGTLRAVKKRGNWYTCGKWIADSER